jgi:hypothetical protein
MRSLVYLDVFHGVIDNERAYVIGQSVGTPLGTRCREVVVDDYVAIERALLKSLDVHKFAHKSIGGEYHVYTTVDCEARLLELFDDIVSATCAAVSLFIQSDMIHFTKNNVLVKTLPITLDYSYISNFLIPNIRYDITPTSLARFAAYKANVTLDYAEEFVAAPHAIDLVEEACLILNRQYATLNELKNVYARIQPVSANRFDLHVVYSMLPTRVLRCVNVDGVLYEESHIARFPNYIAVDYKSMLYTLTYKTLARNERTNVLYHGSFNPDLFHVYLHVMQNMIQECQRDDLLCAVTHQLPLVLRRIIFF